MLGNALGVTLQSIGVSVNRYVCVEGHHVDPLTWRVVVGLPSRNTRICEVGLSLVSKASEYVAKAYKKGFFHLYGANLLLMASGFGLQLFVAHLLPAHTLGDLKVMQSYFALLYSLCGLGLNLAVLKLARTATGLRRSSSAARLDGGRWMRCWGPRGFAREWRCGDQSE